MSVIRIARRYAKSLIELSIEQNKLEKVLEDVNTFQSAVKNRDFYLLLKNPIVNKDKKTSIVDAIFKGKLDELTMSFLKLLINKHREAYLPEIAQEFIHLYRKHKHISIVKLRTAGELSEGTIQLIREKLEENKNTDQQINIETLIEPDLIGGFILEFDDWVYDASISHKLEEFRRELFSENLYISQIIAN